MKKIFVLAATFILLLGMYLPALHANAAEDVCAKYKGVKKVIWNGMELKSGQIGKLIVLKDTPLYKVEGSKKSVSRTLKKGEFYRIYTFKPGMLGLGGVYYVNQDSKVKYETPSKEKLLAVKCINGQVPKTGTTNPATKPNPSPSTPKVLTTKEIVDLNDEKVVLIETENAQGSGIVIAKGLILTNYHVMQSAQEATVTFNSGDVFDVEGLVDFDKTKDIAIIKTSDQFSEKSVTFKESSTGLSKGDKVVAIGNPYGLQNTVSEGIISSFRTENGVKLIQTNADIDHGSSGGGLFNTAGQLIGITTSGFDKASANLNFALAPEVYMPMVKKYSAMNWSTIKAAFPEIPPIFGNVKLGMTKDEVKAATAGTLYSEKDNELVYDKVMVLDDSARVGYEFKDGKLISMFAFHDKIDGDTEIDDLESYFTEMYLKIGGIYGSPKYMDLNWNDDKEGHEISSYWETSEYGVYLSIYYDDEYIYAGIEITNRTN